MLNRHPHGDELTTECTSLHGILPFTVPDNRGPVQEYENPSLRPSCYSIRCVVRINKTRGRQCAPAWRRHVNWYLLLSIAVEIIPLVCAKGTLVNVRVPGGQRINDILSGSSGTQIHGIPAPNAPFVEGPYMWRALPFRAEC